MYLAPAPIRARGLSRKVKSWQAAASAGRSRVGWQIRTTSCPSADLGCPRRARDSAETPSEMPPIAAFLQGDVSRSRP